tara:strand:- start:802 stop:1290 length:489 start_codon:yes stop_codon:yes gene_type:complete
MKKTHFTFLFIILFSTTQAQSIDRITFSAASSGNNSFKSHIGSPYGANLSSSNGNLIVSAEYGENTLKETALVGNIDIEYKQIEINVFPNPSMSNINIQIKHQINFPITAQLFSLNGLLIQEQKIGSNFFEFDVKDLAEGNYILKLAHKKNILKTFNILKTK